MNVAVTPLTSPGKAESMCEDQDNVSIPHQSVEGSTTHRDAAAADSLCDTVTSSSVDKQTADQLQAVSTPVTAYSVTSCAEQQATQSKQQTERVSDMLSK